MSLEKRIIHNHPVIVDSGATGTPATNIYSNPIPDIISSNAARISLRGLAETHILNPTATDTGYDIGAFWVNTANDTVYVCVDNTEGSGIWTEITASGGGGGSATGNLEVRDESIVLSTGATSMDFVGAGVTATTIVDAITVDVPGTVSTDTMISGDGQGTPLGIPLSTDVNNLLQIGTDNFLYALSGSSFTGVSVNPTITGDGNSIALGVPLSTGVNNILQLGDDNLLYVPSGDYFTGVSVNPTITGDGDSIALGVPISTGVGNVLTLGVDNRLFVATGSFGGVTTDDMITGDGASVQLGIPLSTGLNNILQLGDDNFLYVPSGGGGSAIEVFNDSNSLSTDTTSITFTGAGVTATAIGDDVTVDISGVTASDISFSYYYGHTQTGFIATGVDTFFGDANYIEDDPSGMSDGTGTLTVSNNGRYLVDVQGSLSNTASGEVIQLQVDGSVVARTTIRDVGNDDIGTQFGLTYDGDINAGQTVAVRKTSDGLYEDFMIRMREALTQVTINTAGGGSAIQATYEGSNLTTSMTSIDFTGVGVEATSIGGAVTVNITGGGGSSFTGVPVALPITGDGLTTNVGLKLSAAANNLLYVHGSDDGLYGLSGGGSDLLVKDETTTLTSTATELHFIGEGVTATDAGSNVVHVTVPGAASSSTFIADYYMSPSGLDSNPGTFAAPFATLTGVRDFLRTAGRTTDTTIAMRAGTYRLADTVVYSGGTDGATGNYTIRYVNYPNEKPIVNGSVLITGVWSASGNVYWTDLPAATSPFYSLFADGAMKTRARMPATGYFDTYAPSEASLGAKDHVYVQPSDAQYQIAGSDDVDLSHLMSFIHNRSPIRATDPYVADVTGTGLWLATPNALAFNNKSDNGRYWLENHLSFMTGANAISQWYYDTGIQRLYYNPEAGQDPNNIEVEYPQVRQLIDFQGLENKINKSVDDSFAVSLWFKSDYNFAMTGTKGDFTNAGLSGGMVFFDNKYGGPGLEVGLRWRYNISGFPYVALSGSTTDLKGAGTTSTYGPPTYPAGGYWELADGQWHHMVAVHNKTSNKLYAYIDGVKSHEASVSPTSKTVGPLAPTIGWEKSGPPGVSTTNALSGYIDELVLTNTLVSTAAQALELKNMNYTGFNLLAHMPFDNNFDTNSDYLNESVSTYVQASTSYANLVNHSHVTFGPGVTGFATTGWSAHFDNRYNSRSQHKILFEGCAGYRLKGLEFEGITFTNCDSYRTDSAYPMMHNSFGLNGTQIGGDDYVDTIPAALNLIYCNDISFVKCHLKNLAGTAILTEKSKYITADTCYIHDIGYMPVAHRGMSHWLTPLYGNHTSNDNNIHDFGLNHFSAQGIYHNRLGGNKVYGNHIYNGSYCGIRFFNSLWTVYFPNGYNLCYENHVHDVLQKLYDGGAIFGAGYHIGSVIRHNHIHDVKFTADQYLPTGAGQTRGKIRGIYLDEGAKGCLITKNLIYDIATSCIFLHEAKNINIINNKLLEPLYSDNGCCINILVKPGTAGLRTEGVPYGSSTAITGYLETTLPTGTNVVSNICQSSLGLPNLLYRSSSVENLATFIGTFGTQESNLYVDNRVGRFTENQTTGNLTGTISEWYDLYGLEQNSLSGAPMFANYGKKDFRLDSNSPAFTLVSGFEEFEVPDYRGRIYYY